MQIQDIPAGFFRSLLVGGRWPLTAVAGLLGRANGDGSAEWAPAVAYEAFEASSKQTVGSLLRHSGLMEEGRVQRAKVDKLRKAEALDSVASRQRAEADHAFKARQQEDAERREEARAEADERTAKVRKQKGTQHAEADRKASQKAKVAKRATQRSMTAAAKQERAAASTRVKQERKAVSKRRQALSAEEKAANIEGQLESARSARRTDRRSP